MNDMNARNAGISYSEQIRCYSSSLGFSHCGFARAVPLESLRDGYERFLAARDFTGMNYLERYTEQRLHPEVLLPGVQSVIALLMNYYPETLIPEEDNFIISKYAYGRSYRTLIGERLQQLITFLDTSFPGSRSLPFVDSGPVLEKVWAQRCGVGWQGKHSILINEHAGSFFFIGIILTTLDLDPGEPGTGRCGSCTRCMTACPAGALHTPYRLDINKCLSYHTNTNKGEIPDAVRGTFHDRIYGCDICQDVCPFNRKSLPHTEPGFRPPEALVKLRKSGWLAMTEEEFNTLFQHSEIRNKGLNTLKRNMGLALEN